MPARLLSGTELAGRILASLRKDVKALNPHLAIVQVGDDAASGVYIQKKIDACASIGMAASHVHLPKKSSVRTIIRVVEQLNAEPDISGIIVQLPLPSSVAARTDEILAAIDPRKDVDGLTARNLGKTFIDRAYEHLPPATPAGVLRLLEDAKVPLEGMHAVVVGRSNLVGKPLAMMLLNRGATVTVCHSKTRNLAAFTRQADLLISAVGKPGLITAPMVKPGAVVIDVGVSRDEDRLRGDVDTDAVKAVASLLTPVPGGVGPMTVASLLLNCVTAKKRFRP